MDPEPGRLSETLNDEALHAKAITLNVPAGNYVVTASVFAFNLEANEGRVDCNLLSPNDPSHEGSAVANIPKEPTETIVYECGNYEGAVKDGFYNAQIIATAVGSLTG
jgi:hypothetical protein